MKTCIFCNHLWRGHLGPHAACSAPGCQCRITDSTRPATITIVLPSGLVITKNLTSLDIQTEEHFPGKLAIHITGLLVADFPERERLIAKLSDEMDPDNARAFVERVIHEAKRG